MGAGARPDLRSRVRDRDAGQGAPVRGRRPAPRAAPAFRLLGGQGREGRPRRRDHAQAAPRLPAGQHHLRGFDRGSPDPGEGRGDALCRRRHGGAREAPAPVLRLRPSRGSAVQESRRAVQGRPSRRARGAARDDRAGAPGQPAVPPGRGGVPRARAGNHQPQPHRGRCAGDVDPARPDRGDLRRRLSGSPLPPGQQRGPRTLQARGDVLHRQHQVSDAQGPGALLRRHPSRRRADRHPSREAELSQGHLRGLLQGLQPPRRRTGWAWSTRRTRSCAS